MTKSTSAGSAHLLSIDHFINDVLPSCAIRLITGGTVGIVFLLHYATAITFGKLFFAINLPFYFLAVKKMGWKFTLKSCSAVFLLSAFSELLPLAFRLESLNPLYAATMGGLLAGVGLLVLFGHKSSLGGINVLLVRRGKSHLLRQRFFDIGNLLAVEQNDTFKHDEFQAEGHEGKPAFHSMP